MPHRGNAESPAESDEINRQNFIVGECSRVSAGVQRLACKWGGWLCRTLQTSAIIHATVAEIWWKGQIYGKGFVRSPRTGSEGALSFPARSTAVATYQ